jgi:tetratricopeptide (TPR) repeat protein
MNIGFAKYIVVCFVLILFVTVSPVHAQNDRERDPGYVFYKANALYEEGKYDEAIKVYSGLIDQGRESGNLYYNIGNSYFKKGELGKAILNYERANKLIPGDSDLKSNYDFAISKIRTPVSEKTGTFYKKVMALYNGLSIDGLSVLISVIFTVILLYVFIFFMVKPETRYKKTAFVFLIVFFLITSYALFDRISDDKREAVLIAGSSDATFEPVETATVHFTIYEGTKVFIVQKKKEWLKIRRQDGKIGWINKDDLEII